MGKERNQVVLNYLPPADLEIPSATLGVLKTFLRSHGIHVRIIYWNILFCDLVAKYRRRFDDGRHNNDIQLFPFINMLADTQNSEEQKVMEMNLYSVVPEDNLSKTEFDQLWNTSERAILDTINKELEKIDFDKVLLWGISTKFYQWIPGLILSRCIKEKDSASKIVVGGLETKKATIELLKMNKIFDMGIWGEGEYPLLELIRCLNGSTENNINRVPRLVYWNKEKTEIKSSISDDSLYLDLDAIGPIDHDDYFELINEKKMKFAVDIPFEASRGCKWNQCRFCFINEGYVYREKSPETIIKELDFYVRKYHVKKFCSLDSNIIFRDLNKFIELLDCQIKYFTENGLLLLIQGEIIPKNMDAEVIKKISLAGYHYMQIGYEAVSNRLLRKMNKINNFSDNLLFIKFGIRYGIVLIGCNVIMNIPGEDVSDMYETMMNLPFLRFYLGNKSSQFKQAYKNLIISDNCQFYRDILSSNENELDKYSYNGITCYLPKRFITKENRFAIYPAIKPTENDVAWRQIEFVENFYKANVFTYKIIEADGNHIYHEYCNGERIKVFSLEPLDILILKAADKQVVSFKDLHDRILKFHDVTADKLKENMTALKEGQILYYDDSFSNVITIIDMEAGVTA